MTIVMIMRSDNTTPELVRAFQIAQTKLRPKFGKELRIEPLIQNIKEVRAAYDQQWKPILESEQNSDLKHDYYLSIFSPPSRFNPIEHELTHFNVAIWFGNIFCAMASGGYPNESALDFISIYLTQANPDPDHPLKGKIGTIIHEVALEYASQLDKKKIAYIGEFSAGAEKKNQRLGLSKQPLDHDGKGSLTLAYVCEF